jgi:peptidoglycan/LPS O-acetylase OafA/YrhL
MPTRTSSFDVPFPFALPFFRILLHGGFLAVAVFFVMSGYVCSMKPLKLARAGKPDEARRSIASSAFRRVIRLALPATLATTISWFLCQMGGYSLAYTLENSWLNAHSAWYSPDWWSAIKSLLRAIVRTTTVLLGLGLIVGTYLDVRWRNLDHWKEQV